MIVWKKNKIDGFAAPASFNKNKKKGRKRKKPQKKELLYAGGVTSAQMEESLKKYEAAVAAEENFKKKSQEALEAVEVAKKQARRLRTAEAFNAPAKERAAREKSQKIQQEAQAREQKRADKTKAIAKAKRKMKANIAEDLRQLRGPGDPFAGRSYVDFFEGHKKDAMKRALDTRPFSNKNSVIVIEHVPTGKRCMFTAFITQFSDTYSPSFSPQSVYGRMDQIQSYSGTTRTQNLTFSVPSASAKEAVRNLQEVQSLVRFLYPTYEDLGEGGITSATMIAASPILRISWSNWISNGNGSGLLAAVSNFSVTPEIGPNSMGLVGLRDLFAREAERQADNIGRSEEEIAAQTPVQLSEGLLPLSINVTMGYSVLHDFALGYNVHGNKFDSSGYFDTFPYGLSDGGSMANPSVKGMRNDTDDPLNSLSSERQFVLEEMVTKEAKNRSYKTPGSKRIRTMMDIAIDKVTEFRSGEE